MLAFASALFVISCLALGALRGRLIRQLPTRGNRRRHPDATAV